MRQDRIFALEIAAAAKARGYDDFWKWAEAAPAEVVMLADGLDSDDQDAEFERVIDKTHQVMRELQAGGF